MRAQEISVQFSVRIYERQRVLRYRYRVVRALSQVIWSIPLAQVCTGGRRRAGANGEPLLRPRAFASWHAVTELRSNWVPLLALPPDMRLLLGG